MRRIDAAESFWDGRRWVFASGYLRTFEHGREHAQAFERMAINGLPERPEDFAKWAQWVKDAGIEPDEVDYLEAHGRGGCLFSRP